MLSILLRDNHHLQRNLCLRDLVLIFPSRLERVYVAAHSSWLLAVQGEVQVVKRVVLTLLFKGVDRVYKCQVHYQKFLKSDFLNINSVNFFGPKLDFSVLSAMIGVAVMVMLGELEI